MRLAAATVAALALMAGAALAGAPVRSLIPKPRPVMAADLPADLAANPAPVAALPALAAKAPPRAPRSGEPDTDVADTDVAVDLSAPRPVPAAPGGVRLSVFASSMAAPRPQLRPLPRPDDLAGPGLQNITPVAATIRTPAPTGTTSRKGAVCGDPAIKGVSVPPVTARIKGCGLEDGVKVTSVAGIPLSQPALMDCTTAVALKTWVDQGAIPAVGDHGGGLAALDVAGHYACRPRNNQKGEKISEHGRGRAIDISALVLRDGSRLSILKNWGSSAGGRILRAAHSAACGPFGTVLGPAANSFHRDHFHFDTARYRSGSYCR